MLDEQLFWNYSPVFSIIKIASSGQNIKHRTSNIGYLISVIFFNAWRFWRTLQGWGVRDFRSSTTDSYR